MKQVFDRPRFVAVSGPAAGQAIPVPADDLTIGRDSASAIVIPDRLDLRSGPPGAAGRGGA